MAGEFVKNLTSDNFSTEVLEYKGTALVDFWAGWCGPCRMLGPVIDELAAQYHESAKICKLDVDAQGALAAQYGVMSIPTVVIFKNGRESARYVGVQPKAVLEKELI